MYTTGYGFRVLRSKPCKFVNNKLLLDGTPTPLQPHRSPRKNTVTALLTPVQTAFTSHINTLTVEKPKL